MTEIFVSYSRRNKDFTQNFIKALEGKGYTQEDIWVDWNNIPPSSKWEDEIRKGIEATNAVVFILSPDWVISNECMKELMIAVEYNKRLFPIIHQNIDPNKSPKELGSLNWIFFREEDNFEAAMQKLITAINTDLDWVKLHTVLLKRANEWNSRGHDTSFLLRGSELQDAELWLSKSSNDKEPRPAPVQNEYIFASRNDATRRQRNTLIGVSMALVASVVLGVAAVFGGIQAVMNSQKALASQLAAQSISLLDSQPDLSLLLSLESNYIDDQLGEAGPEELGSIVTSMNSVPKLEKYLRAHESDIRAVAFSTDGRWLASTGNPADDSGYVLLWDMTSPHSEFTYQKFTAGSQRILTVDFSSDGKHMAAAGDDKKIYLWHPKECCQPVLEMEANNKVRALKFVRIDGREYIAVVAGDEVTFWNAATGKQNTTLKFEIPSEDDTVRILSLAVSQNKNLLAVGSEDGTITLWDLKSKEMKLHACSYGELENNDDAICKSQGDGAVEIRSVAFNLDGTLLAAGSSDNRIWLWGTQSGELLARSVSGVEGGHINTIAGLAFDPQTGNLASASWDNTVRIWNPGTDESGDWRLELVDVLSGHASSVWAVAFSTDGGWLASGSSDKAVILWDIHQVTQLGTQIAQMDGETWALAVSPDKKSFAAGDINGNIRIWDFDGATLSNERKLMHEGGLLALAYSNNNKWLASSGYTDNTIRIWDAQTGEEVSRIENAHEGEIWSIAFSPDDRWIASASFDQTVRIWDVATREQITPPLQHSAGVYTLAFNADGSRLFVAGFPTDIFSYTLSDLKNVTNPESLVGHASAVNLVTLNPKYPEFLASTSDDKTLLLWNTNTKEHTPQVLGLNESMEAVAFRPSGDWLASATNNNTVLLWHFDAERCSKEWDVNSCQPQIIGSPLVGSNSAVQNVIFLNDTVLISSSEDGQLIQWNLDKSDWYKQACAIVNRPLSDAEYSQYINDQISPTLLNAVTWIAERFQNTPAAVAPSCLDKEDR